ncbi:unnamed protein product [Heterotrigona itama]|uniref:Uncharacterized protein n=1 Tax=Heterotrigona itama TaxID=395501 RepID=A0A6V7HKJ5_9HYME|nr:unnamed protein product [Heterotrigona itama]
MIDGRSATASTDTFAAGRASFDGSDPLSQFAEQRSDPSSAAATDQVRTSRAHASSQPLEPQRDRSCRANLRRLPSDGPTSTDAAEESLEPWLARRAAILDGYTASEKLSMVAGFLPGDEKGTSLSLSLSPPLSLPPDSNASLPRSCRQGSTDRRSRRQGKNQTATVGRLRGGIGRANVGPLPATIRRQSRPIERSTRPSLALRPESQSAENCHSGFLVPSPSASSSIDLTPSVSFQCAKLLADTSVVAFYPGKFVLVTDILDVFGRLVYDRLKVKAECSCKLQPPPPSLRAISFRLPRECVGKVANLLRGKRYRETRQGPRTVENERETPRRSRFPVFPRPGSKVPAAGLPDDFTPDMVPESAKETCRNWFYKIASVRELVPRLYVEMAIIESYGFLTTSEFNAALLRITRMIRGIGDPLVAVYARCYLCRVGLALNETSDFEFVRENFYDFLFTYQQLFGPFVADRLIEQNVAVSSYLNLYSPALDWILRVLVATTRENLLEEVLFRCEDRTNGYVVAPSLLLPDVLSLLFPARCC